MTLSVGKFSESPLSWNPELARERSDIRAVQGQSSLCAYTPNSERYADKAVCAYMRHAPNNAVAQFPSATCYM